MLFYLIYSVKIVKFKLANDQGFSSQEILVINIFTEVEISWKQYKSGCRGWGLEEMGRGG